ncbi:RHS repeat-associated core domain-containing protein [Kitasatospora sp. NPDC101801]|uniref:RHS repeat domain-containing protein n=1 Tax=Kitasatospora sp. NPDC101801 TaxID=3364103 RepID=UPI0038119CF7
MLGLAVSLLSPAATSAAAKDTDRIWSPDGTPLPVTTSVEGTAASGAKPAQPRYQVPTDWTPATADSKAKAGLQAAPQTLAASAGPAGGDGTFSATSLSPSSAWASGGTSGAFTYSYPVDLPPALGGAEPGVELSYDSSSVDGRTSSTNAQASWIGDGWEYNPGFIERSYQVCDKHGIDNSADRCWAGDNATMSLGTHSGELVRDDTAGVWHLKNDDGTKVEFLTGAANGADKGEYVKVTDSAGVSYYFGLNHLPGGDKTDPATNSAWSVPVYSPNVGDPCYDSAKGKASWCNQAWRWNLDHVVDQHGNLTTYSYSAEANRYSRGGAQNQGNGTLTAYTRGGALTSIGYGQRLADQITAKGANKPAAKVLFTAAAEGRCSTAGGFNCTGATLGTANASHWPDVPYEQNCAATGTCTTYGPTFWSNVRLASITTQVLSGGSYKDVDVYALTHSFPDPADTTKPVLWLAGVQRTGKDGGTPVTLPATTFTPVMLPNRVDGTNLVPAPAAFHRPRIQMVTTETGGRTNVDYNLPACSRLNSRMPASADTNTSTCFNVKWYPPGSASDADPVDDWFNRYTVKSIAENDPLTGAPQKITSYTYGPAAWHRNDSALTEAKSRSWDVFRGFADVTITTGDGADGARTQTRTTYLQGMDGDLLTSGARRAVTRANSLGEQVTDDDWLAGQVLESTTYTQADGSPTAYTVNRATNPATTATQARGAGMPALVARYKSTKVTTTNRTLKADGSWRTTGSVVGTDPANGNRQVSESQTADGLAEVCIRTEYATSTNPQLHSLVSRRLTLTGDCGTTATAASTVADTRTLYDGKAFGQAGDTGDATATQSLDRYDGTGTAQYVTTATTGYDTYGRVTSTSDPTSVDIQHPTGAVIRTSYTGATGELPTAVTVTSPAPGSATDWTASTLLSQGRGQVVTRTDLNGKATITSYDALGRITALWLPGRSTAQSANTTFAYVVNGTGGPSSVTTSRLADDEQYRTVTVDIYDGLGRVRQTQTTPGISAYQGRMISDTYYDSHGRTAKANTAWYNDDTAPNGTLFTTGDAQVPAQTRTSYDGQDRPTASVFYSLGQEQWRSSVAYPGADRTDLTPAQGGTPTSTVTDARGRAVQLWQYRTATATGNRADADVTTTAYTVGGQVATRTDSTGKNVWSYEYDLRGRSTKLRDPDTGTSTTSYDASGRVLTRTDGRGVATTRTYDLIGRQVALFEGTTTTDPTKQLAGWSYDSIANGKGKPAASTRYVGGTSGDAYTSRVYGYDDGYRSTGSVQTLPGKVVGQTGPFSYATRASYNPVSGSLKATNTPVLADRPAETINYTYDVNGPMLSFGSASTTYDLSTNYDAYGRPVRTTVNPWGTQIVSTVNYDEATGRVLSQYVDKQTAATGATQQTGYTYDPSGRVTSVRNVPDNAPAQTDLQCFGYDYLGRLNEAWTDRGTVTTKPQPSVAGLGGCTATTPVKTAIGGPAPYWQSYGYDLTGNRTSLVKHDPAGSPGADVTVTQTFPTAGLANNGDGTGGPHALQAGTGDAPATYRYDAAGNTTAITTTTGASTLSWDVEGKLTRYSKPGAGGSTDYVYDVSGNLLVRYEAGKITAFLGADELTYDVASGKSSTVRSYTLPNGLTAVRSGTSMTFQIADPHGTNTLALDATSLVEARRPSDPFGNARGAQAGSWTGSRGFIGGLKDDGTGLTTLGARQYQPSTGRFVSPDLLLAGDNPQQWNGYAYGDNAPTYLTDPTGLIPDGCGTEGACYGYSPGAGCPGGCGSTANTDWGQSKGLTPTKGGGCRPGYCGVPKAPLTANDKASNARTAKAAASNCTGSMPYGCIKATSKVTKKPSAVTVGLQWISGTGPKEIHFGPGDEFTEELRRDHSMDVVRDLIGKGIAKGKQSDKLGYNVLSREGAYRLFEDYTDVVTLGLTAGIKDAGSGGRYGSATSVFVGSYDISYQVKSVDKRSGVADVEITVTNKTTFNSLVHPPVLRNFWDSYIGGPINRAADALGGPISTKTQYATWSESMVIK